MIKQATRDDALKRLNVIIGHWRLGLGHSIPPAEAGGGRSVFEWAIDGQFLVQRTETPDPQAPNGLSIVAYDAKTEALTQHYFDSRGVVRICHDLQKPRLDTAGRKSRVHATDFSQRFSGRFNAAFGTMTGTWELDEGSGWRKDFDLTYARVEP